MFTFTFTFTFTSLLWWCNCYFTFYTHERILLASGWCEPPSTNYEKDCIFLSCCLFVSFVIGTILLGTHFENLLATILASVATRPNKQSTCGCQPCNGRGDVSDPSMIIDRSVLWTEAAILIHCKWKQINIVLTFPLLANVVIATRYRPNTRYGPWHACSVMLYYFCYTTDILQDNIILWLQWSAYK